MRDPERQNRFGSSFTVTMPDFPSMTVQPKYIRMYQKMGSHDVVELYYQRFSPFLTQAVKTGVPVTVDWKNDKVSGKFIGYTTDSVHFSEQTIKRGVKVTCIAESYVTKETSSKIWVNKTASEIVTDIAKLAKLKPVVTPSNVRFSQQSLAGITRWEKVRELADRIGYGFHVSNAELHFHPIDVMIDKFMTVTPVMAFIDPFQNVVSEYNAQTLDSFAPRTGDFVQGDGHYRTDKTVSGVDPVTAKLLTYTTTPSQVGKQVRKTVKDALFSSNETSIVVGSQTMAQAMAVAKAQLSRLSIPAEGVGQGDPRIAPWRTIEVRGIDSVSDGYWIVDSANHFIHVDGRYQVEFTCLTDGTGANKPSATRPSSAGNAPTRNVIQELAGAATNTPTTVKLSAPAAMISQKDNGFKVNPRRWVGV